MERLLRLALMLCLTASTVGAQSGWLPATVDMGPNLKGPARAAALAHLQAIEQLLKQVPELAHPDGFEIRPHFTGHRSRTGLGDAEHPDYVVEYQYRVNFFYPSLAKNKYAIGAIIFAVNANENMRPDLDPQGRVVFGEQPRWPLVPFSVATYGTSASGTLQAGEDFSLWAWFTPGAELPWRSVSREDYYNGTIAAFEGNAGGATGKNGTAKTPYQRWLDEAPQRKQQRDSTLTALAQLQPAAEVAKLRKTLEDVERDATQELKRNEVQDREDAKAEMRPVDALRAELKRMTPAERKLPAIVDTDPTRTEWRATGASMRDRDTVSRTVSRVLTPNYDFWRARRSRAEVRTIGVYFEASATAPVQNAMYQTVRKFNWRALAALADEPPKE